jgi:hypothetical protein
MEMAPLHSRVIHVGGVMDDEALGIPSVIWILGLLQCLHLTEAKKASHHLFHLVAILLLPHIFFP